MKTKTIFLVEDHPQDGMPRLPRSTHGEPGRGASFFLTLSGEQTN